jgi:hypothetical protein
VGAGPTNASPETTRISYGGKMLIKLTEICSAGAFTTNQKFTLREILVNPEHVVMIREEQSMQKLNETGGISPGLDNNHRFSKLTINRGQTGTEIIVVGAPEIIEKQLSSSTKQLLRG